MIIGGGGGGGGVWNSSNYTKEGCQLQPLFNLSLLLPN